MAVFKFRRQCRKARILALLDLTLYATAGVAETVRVSALARYDAGIERASRAIDRRTGRRPQFPSASAALRVERRLGHPLYNRS